jgi:hypothetical protein
MAKRKLGGSLRIFGLILTIYIYIATSMLYGMGRKKQFHCSLFDYDYLIKAYFLIEFVHNSYKE